MLVGGRCSGWRHALNESWAGKMAGALSSRVTDRTRGIRGPDQGRRVPESPSAESAELVAAMFAAEIRQARELSGLLLPKGHAAAMPGGNIETGTLRRRLLEQGLPCRCADRCREMTPLSGRSDDPRLSAYDVTRLRITF